MAVVAEVSGNAWALDAILEDAARDGVARWCSLGNLVGLGPAPIQVLERARSAVAVCRGVKDWCVSEQELFGVTAHTGRQMIPWTMRRVSESHREWFRSWPDCTELPGISLHGGCRHDPPPPSTADTLSFGSGHFIERRGTVRSPGATSGRSPCSIRRDEAIGLHLWPGSAWLPGTLGQACYAVVRPEAVEFRTVSYPTAGFRSAMQSLLSTEVDQLTIDRCCETAAD